MSEPNDVHVMPVNDLVDHDETRECWCQPTIERVCDECLNKESTPPCWKCHGEGALPVDKTYPEDAIIVHNAADGRD